MNRHRHPRKQPRRQRPWWVIAGLALAASTVVARAFYLQVWNRPFLEQQAKPRHAHTITVPAPRAMIVDRHNEPLAVSSPVESICADPVKLLASGDHSARLAQALGQPIDSFQQQLASAAAQGKRFIYVQRQLAPYLANQIMASLGKNEAVWLEREYRRFYPDAEVMGHVLGFTDMEDRGLEGLELAFDASLRGQPGARQVIYDRNRRAIEPLAQIRDQAPGHTLQLSLDRRLQYLVYRSLKTAVVKHRARAAMAVLIDVASGEILALVNQPAGNPNDRHQRHEAALLRNRTVTDQFEPGSTLKPFAVAAALEHKLFTPNTLIDTAPGWLKIDRYIIRDLHNYRTLSVAGVLAKSSNVGISKIAQRLAPQDLWRLYQQLGFGQPTGLGLVGEQAGGLAHFSDWNTVSSVTRAYGYGIAVNTLQLAQAYTVLAADGVRRPLSILRRESVPNQGERVLSVKTSRQVRAMLEAAVGAEGTGAAAAVPGYRVAGKTGTVYKHDQGRYVRDHYYSLFAGMAPASQPRLVLVVVIDDPRGKDHFGGKVAAPVFADAMAGALHTLNIPPDDLPDSGALLVSYRGAQP